jgi:hypothetical protein
MPSPARDYADVAREWLGSLATMPGAPEWDGWEHCVGDLSALLARVADEARVEERHDILRRMGWLAETEGMDPADHFKREFERAGRVGALTERERCAKVADEMLGNPTPDAWPNVHDAEAWNGACLRVAAAIRGGRS